MRRSALLSCFLLPLFALAQPGTLDPSFGVGGQVQTTIGAGSDAVSVAVQADGRIVCAVISGNNGIVIRYLSNGSVDTGFGVNGMVDLGAEVPQPWKVLVQPDGKILVCGEQGSAGFVARLLSDGDMDPGFGTDGVVLTPVENSNEFVWDMALRPDGRIVVLSTHSVGGIGAVQLTSLNADGTFDDTFGTNGITRVQPPPSSGYYPTCLALQANGKVVVGSGWDNPLHYRIVFRWTADGTLDDTFGDAGIANLTDIAAGGIENVSDILIDAGGGILVAGTKVTPIVQEKLVFVTRLLDDGGVDPNYGTNGNAASADVGYQLFGMEGCLQSDGKLLMGSLYNGPSNNYYPQVHRFNADGTLDTGFGTNGVATTIPSGSTTQMPSLALQPDGKLVVSGRRDVQVALARLFASGPTGIEEHVDGGLHLAPLGEGRFRLWSDAGDLAHSTIRVLDELGRLQPAALERTGSTITITVRGAASCYLVQVSDGRTQRTIRSVNTGFFAP